MNNKDLGMTGKFKKTAQESGVKKVVDTTYKETSKPQNSFDNLGKDLLKNVELTNDKELLASVNKSIVVPASLWCKFHAILYASDNDYSYELLEDMMDNFIIKNKLDKNEDYIDKKKILEKDELKKIKKKKIQKKR